MNDLNIKAGSLEPQVSNDEFTINVAAKEKKVFLMHEQYIVSMKIKVTDRVIFKTEASGK